MHSSLRQVNHKAREETRARARGWRVEGSEYTGRSVRRSVLDASGKPISHSEGAVRGWLDASRSDYPIQRENQQRCGTPTFRVVNWKVMKKIWSCPSYSSHWYQNRTTRTTNSP